MKHWSIEDRSLARKMRLAGASFSEIKKELPIPKSTLSLWVKDIYRPECSTYTNRNEWLQKIQKLAVAANKKKRQLAFESIKTEAKREAEKIDLTEKTTQKLILTFLYWAEGSKGRDVVTFANTDPRLILLFTNFLRNTFPIDESKFRVRLHLHSYHNEKVIKQFWSELLHIPVSQFTKTYRKKRNHKKTFRTNFAGICYVKYNSVYLQKHIMQYAYTLAEKIIGKIDF